MNKLLQLCYHALQTCHNNTSELSGTSLEPTSGMLTWLREYVVILHGEAQ
jgi:hypothetical protein